MKDNQFRNMVDFRLHVPSTPFETTEPSMTKQSFAEGADIYNILKQYQKTGVITHINTAQASYVDLPEALDYQLALHVQARAADAFSSLPASVRDRFANDPERFLAAFGDPAQEAFLREMGLLRPQPPAEGSDA